MARTTTESKPKTRDTRTKTAETFRHSHPGAAFKDAISKGLKNPEDYIYRYTKDGKNYFQHFRTLKYTSYNKGGTVSRKRKGGTVSRKKGSKIMQGYKAGGKV
jgi:hypothetical protein